MMGEEPQRTDWYSVILMLADGKVYNIKTVEETDFLVTLSYLNRLKEDSINKASTI